LIDSDGTGHDLLGHYGNPKPVERLDVAAYHAFFERVRAGFVDRDAVARERQALEPGDGSRATKQQLDRLLSTLDEMAPQLVLPIFGSGETEQGPWLLGLLGFRDERVEGAFDLDDIDVFRRLASECARTIEATQVYERVVERDRLAAIG